MLTNRHHLRGAGELAERFGAVLRCPRAGLHEFEARRPEPQSATAGARRSRRDVTAHEVGSLCARRRRASRRRSVPARSPSPTGRSPTSGGLAFVPDSLMDDPEETKRGHRRARSGRSSTLDFDVLLMAHGAPIPVGGKQALATFADSPRTASLD